MPSWYKAFNAEVEVSSLESFVRHLSRSTNVALLGRAYLALPESFVASLACPLPSSLFKLTNSSNVFFFFFLFRLEWALYKSLIPLVGLG